MNKLVVLILFGMIVLSGLSYAGDLVDLADGSINSSGHSIGGTSLTAGNPNCLLLSNKYGPASTINLQKAPRPAL